MKCALSEHLGCFAIELVAENTQEAALIVRLGMDSRKKLNSISSHVKAAAKEGEEPEFSAFMAIAKHRKANSYVPKRK